MIDSASLAAAEALVERVEDLSQLPAEPVVSVVIVTFNHAEFIEQALDGALLQETPFPIEIIVADDASTDGTRDIVRAAQRRRPDVIRLRLARENLYSRLQRYPAYGSRAAARGTYVALCEGDDYWTDPNKLKMQVDLLESRPDIALCFTATDFVDEQAPGSSKRVGAPDGRTEFERIDLLEYNFVTTCTVLYRSDADDAMPAFYWKTPVGDWPLFMTVAKSGRIGFIDEVTAIRRIHNGGEWSKLDLVGQLRCSIDTREHAVDELSDAERKVWHRFLSGHKRRLAKELLVRRRTSEAIKLAREGLHHKVRSDRPFSDLYEFKTLLICSVPVLARVASRFLQRRSGNGAKAKQA